VFEAAARHLHFGRAAEELSLDPTAVSHQIRNLEAVLGVRLFIRRPRPLRLTDEGKLLFPAIRDSLEQMEKAVAEVQRRGQKPLVISMTLAFASEWFIPRLASIKSSIGFEISVHADNAPANLSAGEIDLALRSQEEPGQQHQWRHLFDDHFIAVAAPQLVAGDDKGPTSAQLPSLPLIEYRWSSPQRKPLEWRDWCQSAGLSFNETASVTNFTEESHAIGAAVGGAGMALISERLADRRLRQGELVELSEHRLPAPPFWGVWRADHPRAADIDSLLHAIAEKAAN